MSESNAATLRINTRTLDTTMANILQWQINCNGPVNSMSELARLGLEAFNQILIRQNIIEPFPNNVIARQFLERHNLVKQNMTKYTKKPFADAVRDSILQDPGFNGERLGDSLRSSGMITQGGMTKGNMSQQNVPKELQQHMNQVSFNAQKEIDNLATKTYDHEDYSSEAMNARAKSDDEQAQHEANLMSNPHVLND